MVGRKDRRDWEEDEIQQHNADSTLLRPGEALQTVLLATMGALKLATAFTERAPPKDVCPLTEPSCKADGAAGAGAGAAMATATAAADPGADKTPVY